MEDGGGQQDRGAGLDGLVEVLQLAGAAGGDDLGRGGSLSWPDDGQIVAGLGAVAGLAGGQDHGHAEAESTFLAHSTASAPVAVRPPSM